MTSYDSNDLPEDWSEVFIADLVVSLNAGVSVNGEGRSLGLGEKGVLKVSAVSYGSFDATAAKVVIKQSEIVRLREAVEEGRIIVSRSNSPEFVGASARVNCPAENLFLPDKLWQMRIEDERDESWLSHVLHLGSIRKNLSSLGTGTSDSMKNISKGDLLTLRLPFPPDDERWRIGDILDFVHDSCELLQDRLSLARTRRKALMQQLLTGKRRFPGFTKPWKKVAIGDVLKEVKRPVVWNDEETYKLLSVRRRSGGLFLREELQGRKILTKKMATTKTGDFLISKMQVVHGATAMTTPEFDGMHISGSYVVLRSSDESKLDIRYFDWAAKTKWMYHQAYVSSYGVHIEKMTFNLKDYLKREVELPPTIDEQIKIIETLDLCDQEITLLEQQLKAYQRQKRGLMQQLLTGKRRVKVPAVEERS